MIAPYPLYNILTVFAPRAPGGNGILPSVPGTLQPDGSIDRTAPAVGKATMTTSTASVLLQNGP